MGTPKLQPDATPDIYPVEFEGRLLRIREIGEGDVEAALNCGTDPVARRYVGWLPHTLDEAREFVEKATAEARRTPRKRYQLVNEVAATGQVDTLIKLTVTNRENRRAR